MKRTDEQLQELLLRELSGAGKLRRKQLIEAGIAALGMEAGSDADLTPGAPLTMMKSRLGMVLTGLIHAGSIREDEAGFLHLERAQDIEFAPAAIRAFITRTLEEKGMLAQVQRIDLSDAARITMGYLGRFEVQFQWDADFDYKLDYLAAVTDKLEANEKGVIDMTQDGKASFIPS